VQVTLEEDEIGNCTYRQSRRVQFPVSIALSVIGEIVDSEDRSLEDMVEQIKERALEEAAESDPGGGELGETDYFDMETSSTEDTETSVNKQQIERSLREYIRTNYGPQEAEEIFNR
jgi:hypothetical protein